MSKKDQNNRIGVVYSTDPTFQYQTEGAKEATTLPANQQKLYVQLDKKQRAGKQVSLVTGFVGSDFGLAVLGKLLKTKCGVGGTVKDGEIIIQGDFRSKIQEALLKEGYKVVLK
jgi:translation initiation factor 1